MPRATEQELRIWVGASNLEPELKVGAVVRAGAQGRYVRTRIGYEKEFEFAALGQGLERKSYSNVRIFVTKVHVPNVTPGKANL